jgi:hypothetical protein
MTGLVMGIDISLSCLSIALAMTAKCRCIIIRSDIFIQSIYIMLCLN